ncbi:MULTISPECIES: plasmid partitioning protein RepB [Phyllobacterium]|uniref:plasmid partitioning protein RepB n=1 Tax=Phyllobacterium TaxID=28100 RepID=UPI001CBB0B78|nr:plasmid partitioning protein RepB [Phyllobacterium calauticae]MBZ3695465.1 plasmid partitioning protein RepB [Phyllobacterium calauticae]
MARKGLMAGLLEEDEFTAVNSEEPHVQSPRSGRGAFGMMSRAADEMANKVEAAEEIEKQLLIGDTVIELDPNELEGSFITDRIADDRFEELVQAIRERGQDSPILVRPHPTEAGRFQIVFGHRRTRAAKELGVKVRAVVKALSDREHVIAQGQENTAREDLSFIERTMFASRLVGLGFDNPTILSALATNKTVLSKMMSVASQVPETILQAIGAAKNIGRERWYELSVSCRDPGYRERAQVIAASERFTAASSDDRFNMLLNLEIADAAKEGEQPSTVPSPARQWFAPDRSVQAVVHQKGKNFKLSMKSDVDQGFGTYLTDNLDQLFEAYLASKTELVRR